MPSIEGGERAGRRADVVVDRKRLEVVRYRGDEAKPTIVMLHEGLGSVAMWKDFPEKVAATTECGVLVYSRYGHGKSEKLVEKRTTDFMRHEAQVVLPELLEQFGIRRPILLGHSDGASIAIIYAGASREKPQALILEAPHVFVEDLTVTSITKIRETFQTSDLAKKLGRYHHHADKTFWGWNDAWLDPRFRNWNIEEYLDGIACPVLLIQGEEDEYGTLAQVTAIQKRVPRAEAVVLEKCGHSPHRDQEEKTLEAISGFVARVTGERNTKMAT
jgi:pimeloyl-ACP methyl ester carboxylesterase